MSDAYQILSEQAARAVADQLRTKPDSCFGLPTSNTPRGCYRLLSQWSREGALDWSQARCFALDDYLDATPEMSFSRYLEENLYQFTNLPRKARFNPVDANDYDALIASCGGLDLILLGIGLNGHVAFNEPGIPALSWTHCTWLTSSTREASASVFGSLESVPTRGVTMGIQTILSSRRIILMASGEKKVGIVRATLEGPVTAAVPASLLRSHANFQILCDFN